MKKAFTLIACFVPGLLMAQNRLISTEAQPLHDVSKQEKELLASQPILVANPVSTQKAGVPAYGTEVGTTAYDYHSNSSIDSKIAIDQNGNVAVVWTKGDLADPNGATRRIGYNFYNSTSGTFSGEESLGTRRLGWPSIANQEGTSDIVFAHNAPLAMAQRPTAGTGTWTYTDLDAVNSGADTFDANVFCASAATGDTLHLIANSTVNGIANVFLYYRSPDNGATWDKVNEVIAGMDTSNFLMDNGGITSSDTYVMTARGDVVAIVAGGWYEHVHFWKSTDRGETWTHNLIFELDTFNAPILTDGQYFMYTTGMDHAVAIDHNGMVHVAAGMVGTGSTSGPADSYFPYNPGLIYWNESHGFNRDLDDPADSATHILLTFVDENGDGINSTPFNFDSIGRISNAGVITNPGIALADDNTVVLTWNAPNENAPVIGVTLQPTSSDNLSRYNRDLYAIASLDGGVTWVVDSARNIADDIDGIGAGLGTLTEEESHSYTYPYIGSDSMVHMLYQQAFEGGGNLINGGPHVEKSMVHYSFPYWKVTGVQPPPSGLAEDVRKNVEFSLAPNPAKDRVNLNLNLRNEASYLVKVTNLLGQEIQGFQVALQAGLNQVSLDLNRFEAGIYLISLESGKNAVTRKLVIE